MTQTITVDDLAEARRRAVVADAEATRLMLDYEGQESAAASQLDTPMAGMVARSMIPTEIGQAMGWSEQQVRQRLFVARTARDRLPRVWLAHLAGSIDADALREIVRTVGRLVHDASVERLDGEAACYAPTHTTAELRRWLRRFVQRVEAQEAEERAEAEREKRHVTVRHGDDGMSWLEAYLPSPMAAAIERRLHRQARTQRRDGRTLPQKQADLLASWLTTAEAGAPAVDATICVTVGADVLAGARAGFAEGADGSWSAPAAWIAEIARSDNPFWYRMVRDPVTDDVLSVEYVGRFAAATLRTALELRDGVCVHPGCLVPAWRCEIDHVVPWPRGRTTGSNLVPRSKAHHAHKSHGMSPRQARRSPPGHLVADLVFEYVAA